MRYFNFAQALKNTINRNGLRKEIDENEETKLSYIQRNLLAFDPVEYVEEIFDSIKDKFKK